ncbi:MAG TPA: hypothetical protein VMW25_05030 [Clostridia bacterium]|nr:hypothetical protein [Clostridia bacterium]
MAPEIYLGKVPVNIEQIASPGREREFKLIRRADLPELEGFLPIEISPGIVLYEPDLGTDEVENVFRVFYCLYVSQGVPAKYIYPSKSRLGKELRQPSPLITNFGKTLHILSWPSGPEAFVYWSRRPEVGFEEIFKVNKEGFTPIEPNLRSVMGGKFLFDPLLKDEIIVGPIVGSESRRGGLWMAMGETLNEVEDLWREEMAETVAFVQG